MKKRFERQAPQVSFLTKEQKEAFKKMICFKLKNKKLNRN